MIADGGRLGGRVALVLGGAQGIGRATAELFAAEGAAVVIADIAEPAGTAVADGIRARGGRASFVRTDARDLQAVEAAVRHGLDRFHGLHAAVLSVYRDERGKVTGLAEGSWDRTVDLLLKSGYALAHAAIPAMIASGGGSLVFISSVQAMLGHPEEPAYAAAKAGLLGLARQIAVDFGPEGIRANCLLPALVLVDRNRALWEADPALLQRQAGCYPLRRVGQPEDVARAALFLASDDAAFITGVTLPVDGGFSIQASTAATYKDYLDRG